MPSVLAIAAAVVLSLLVAGSAVGATVPLNGRSFDAACAASAAGDVVTVPAGSYGSQTITCQKAVTFQLDANAQLSYLDFSGANGPTVSGGWLTGSGGGGAAEIYRSSNVTLRGARINNTIYVEGSVDSTIDGNVIEPAAGGTSWSNGDMIDVYEQTRTAQPNTGLTISNNIIHGLRAPSASAHSDAIQLCNCGNPDQVPRNIKIVRNRFYDNECMNIRANERDELLIEQNIFGDTMTGISGCGAYALDVYYASADVRYNTFVGKQKVQVDTSADVGQSQTWVGNAGNGMSAPCGAIRATYSHNVWTQQKCGSTDKQVASLKIAADGTALSGSPIVDAGDSATFPAQDFNGGNRFVGGAPDAGAYEFGAVAGTGTPAPTAPGSTGPRAGAAPAAAAPTGLVAAFGFDEASGTVVHDASGHGLDGVRRGASLVPMGRFGRALSFDGVNDRVTVPDSARLRLSAGLTLEAWVRPTGRGRSRLVLSRGGAKGMSYGLYASKLRAPAGSVRTATAKASSVRRARGRARLPLHRWSHVAVTFNGQFVRIYVNGEWISSRKAPGALIAAAGALRIGGGASRTTSFRGRIDEVRVYDHALTGAEIQSDMARPIDA
ncbi:MAG TPA: LamG-like jellyroll fold domain-containing protein [Baekduia sp.]|nr:LamG-like jellyroll fold domain-containing protein [Baekduia sp.]